MTTPGYHQSASNNWGTPLEILDSARHVFKGRIIDLDPASSVLWQQRVKARWYCTEPDVDPGDTSAAPGTRLVQDGLSVEWQGYGRVFCNPPYGGLQRHFVQRAISAYGVLDPLDDPRGLAWGCILLVNAATSEQWFQPLWDHTLCFPRHRTRFIRPDGTEGGSPGQGRAVVLLTHNLEMRARFAQRFEALGTVARRWGA